MKEALTSLTLAASMALSGASSALATGEQDSNSSADLTTTLNLGDNLPGNNRKDLPFKVFTPNLASTGNNNELNASPEATAKELPFQTIAQRINGGFTKSDMFAISNEDGWEYTTNDLNYGHGMQNRPDIDFEKEFVVAVFNGFGFTQREGITITGVEDAGDHYVVDVLRNEPKFDTDKHPYSKDPSSAYHLAKVPGKYDPNKPVEFRVKVDPRYLDLKEVSAVGFDEFGNKFYGPMYVEGISLPEEDKNATPFTSLASGGKSEIDYAGKTFVEDQRSLEYIWAKLGRTDEVPKLDFEGNTVLFVTKGPNEAGGKISVKGITEDEVYVHVTVELQAPRTDKEQNRGSYELIEWKNGPKTGKFGKKTNVVMYEILAPYVPPAQLNSSS